MPKSTFYGLVLVRTFRIFFQSVQVVQNSKTSKPRNVKLVISILLYGHISHSTTKGYKNLIILNTCTKLIIVHSEPNLEAETTIMKMKEVFSELGPHVHAVFWAKMLSVTCS